MGNGGINLHGFQRFAPLLFLALELHGAHIVETVGHFNQNDANILGHGHEHFSEAFHLRLFFAHQLHTGQLGDTLYQVGYGGAELLGNHFMGDGGIFHGVVEQSRHDGVLVQTHFHGDFRRGNDVGHIGVAVFPPLTGVCPGGEFISPADSVEIHGDIGVFDFLFQLQIHGLGFLDCVLRVQFDFI